MTKLYMLDTNMVSYIAKASSPAARARLATLPFGHVACLSSITEGELQYGLAKSIRRESLRSSLEWFLARFQVFSWGRQEAAAYGELRAKQEAAGKTLETMDMLIAAHALTLGATLVTHDKVFERVADLNIEDWATDL